MVKIPVNNLIRIEHDGGAWIAWLGDSFGEGIGGVGRTVPTALFALAERLKQNGHVFEPFEFPSGSPPVPMAVVVYQCVNGTSDRPWVARIWHKGSWWEWGQTASFEDHWLCVARVASRLVMNGTEFDVPEGPVDGGGTHQAAGEETRTRRPVPEGSEGPATLSAHDSHRDEVRGVA